MKYKHLKIALKYLCKCTLLHSTTDHSDLDSLNFLATKVSSVQRLNQTEPNLRKYPRRAFSISGTNGRTDGRRNIIPPAAAVAGAEA